MGSSHCSGTRVNASGIPLSQIPRQRFLLKGIAPPEVRVDSGVLVTCPRPRDLCVCYIQGRTRLNDMQDMQDIYIYTYTHI